MKQIEYVQVDEDTLNFLKVVYFGDISDPMKAASNRAYRDFNRTIRFGNMPQYQRDSLRDATTEYLRVEIVALVKRGVSSQSDYDMWHYDVCDKIRSRYRNEGIEFYYGQAQKWINMTMKYLYVIGEYTFDGIFQYLHIPVDNYIFTIAEKELGIPQPKIRWSRWDNYNRQYMAYQTALRQKICGYEPLRWEFKFWMKEARQLEQENTPVTLNKKEKIRALEDLQANGHERVEQYYDTLERIGDLKNNYHDYMTTAPIHCDKELERLPKADYDLCCALLTMLLREDHFCNGSFGERYRAGDVQPIVKRMIDLLSTEK